MDDQASTGPVDLDNENSDYQGLGPGCCLAAVLTTLEGRRASDQPVQAVGWP